MNPFKHAILSAVLSAGMGSISAYSQPDSVDVAFYYQTVNNPSRVFLAGEFNRWANNQSGRITDPNAEMAYDPQTRTWSKTVRLRVGGPVPLPDPGRSVPGAYQYKFNENGLVSGWKPDPLNPLQNAKDSGNSLVFARNPTLLRLLPNSVSGLVKSQKPEISAFIFPSVLSTVDTGSITIRLDGVDYGHVGAGYDPDAKRFLFTSGVPLRNGRHSLGMAAQCEGDTAVSDSTTFIVQAGTVVLFTRPDTLCLRAEKTVAGAVEDKRITQAALFRNADSMVVPVSGGGFSASVPLEEGDNLIRAAVTDSSGVRQTSDSISVRYRIDHAPKPRIVLSLESGAVRLAARGNDPDGGDLQFAWWSDDGRNPAPLNITSDDSVLVVPKPPVPGEYYFDLSVEDPDGNEGIARTFFTVESGGSVVLSSVNSNPDWVRNAVVYEIYLPAFTAEGTLAAAEERLSDIAALGANTVWLMPIYENGETVNEGNAGYNITDFYKIHPQFGTLDDFSRFVAAAHKLGMRVIIDSTPNHVSARHPWVREVELYRDYANSRPIIEKRILGDNRGMGQSAFLTDGYPVYAHYSDWTLANLNYTSVETRYKMTEMYEWWLLKQSVDGFRMDVYWGPQNRYGSAAWWRPFREEVKRVKPEAFILGETDGTGTGTERNYADGGGACDAAYDWYFFNQAKTTLSGGSVDDLDRRVRNFSSDFRYNYYTGVNSRYFRFLENHDEIRIAGAFPAVKTRAAAVLLATAPGIPMVYAGQEAGETSQRGKIQWQRSGANELTEWYAKLFRIRNRFAAFRSDEIRRVTASPGRVYAFLRPDSFLCGITAINFSGDSAKAALNLSAFDLTVHGDTMADGRTYFMNDVLNDTSYRVVKDQFGAFTAALGPYGASVFVLSDTLVSCLVPRPSPSRTTPFGFEFLQNYPNPFNSNTKIKCRIPDGQSDSVSLVVYDLLGKTVRVLAKGRKSSGECAFDWDGRNAEGNPVASGIYVCRLSIGRDYRCIKMAYVR